MFRIGKSIELESRLTVALGRGRIFWVIVNTLKLDCGDGATTTVRI